MKHSLIVILAIFMSATAFAQKPIPPQPGKQHTNFWIQSKNYYLLTLFEQDKNVSQLLKSDTLLSRFAKQKIADLKSSVKDCKDAACYPEALKFTEGEIQQVGLRLKTLYQSNNALGLMVKNKLVPSGCYSMYHLNGSELLMKAWEEDAGAVNYTIAVYAEGKKPNYPTIDSISYNVKSKGYVNLIYDASAILENEIQPDALFFEPALQAALTYLQINQRADPANYEPMESTVNKLAVDLIKTVKWANYPYTHIMVPGAGPGDLVTALSGEGMLRCRLAAKQYRLGVAPFIMVSGGKAHPFKTKYCEAEEMKRFLVNELDIPAKAVIMEPHARHTTTNLRNGLRLVYKYGIPANKPGLIITDKSQTDYIMTMDGRSRKELGYVPYKLGKRLADTEVEYYAVPEVKQIDPDEPLDPR
ncbi:YdcF family protein [Mucilaginibacter ginkgonis]|uniref:YdcF family protein n=1 Tax=Mucilaginibacter ginkgonis TaxID=2682091 RepID=A0A6I4IN69_9SPHI|nr:YdcF family protein [Mucilaginibacter ginkgonis]QQL51248.1 YdcF family protein [Mucilaginibacter ginkgonis]